MTSQKIGRYYPVFQPDRTRHFRGKSQRSPQMIRNSDVLPSPLFRSVESVRLISPPSPVIRQPAVHDRRYDDEQVVVPFDEVMERLTMDLYATLHKPCGGPE